MAVLKHNKDSFHELQYPIFNTFIIWQTELQIIANHKSTYNHHPKLALVTTAEEKHAQTVWHKTAHLLVMEKEDVK